jgi:tetratricopeptide (TPR) repeat protein
MNALEAQLVAALRHLLRAAVRSVRKAAADAGGWIQHRRVPAVCLVLATITLAVFGQTTGFGFVNYDDDSYVYGNPVVKRGLTLKGAVWALTYGEIGHWHPLTWLTHMADCQAYGLWAGGHHLTNIVLHAAAVVLLFLALREMTGSLWRSAFVAGVFGIHPLRAESVAWVAERKDVLSGVFFMLTLWAYGRYARQPSRWRYAAVAVAYALGLLSKNTLVTLPFVLLLLDWWPLHRVTLDGAGNGKVGAARFVAPFWRLIKEKIPLFLLSVGSCLATFLVPEKLLDTDRIPFPERIGNAVVSYGVYLRQMVFPAGLAVPYVNPPNGLPFWKVALAIVLLAAISISVLACRKRRPYLLVGWLWYLGMLVPTIGIVQISYYWHADRYTYLPGIGLVLAGTWAAGDWSAGWKHRRALLGGLMAAVMGALMVCAWIQTGYWKDGETLWIHTLACTSDNNVAHINLGSVLVQEASLDEAMAPFQRMLQINPDNADAHVSLGNILTQKGEVDEAITHFQKALQIRPNYALAHNNLGNILMQKGEVDEAIAHFQKAVQIRPNYAQAHNNLALALLQKGRAAQAIAQYQNALRINPDNAEAHYNLATALLQKGNVTEAIAHFQQAAQIEPADPWAKNKLAWLLATCPQASLRNGNKAVELATQADELAGEDNPDILHTLAAAFAEAGRFAEAVETAQRALRLAESQSNTGLAGQLQSELKLYQAGKPFHGPAQPH